MSSGTFGSDTGREIGWKVKEFCRFRGAANLVQLPQRSCHAVSQLKVFVRNVTGTLFHCYAIGRTPKTTAFAVSLHIIKEAEESWFAKYDDHFHNSRKMDVGGSRISVGVSRAKKNFFQPICVYKPVVPRHFLGKLSFRAVIGRKHRTSHILFSYQGLWGTKEVHFPAGHAWEKCISAVSLVKIMPWYGKKPASFLGV